MEYFTPCTISFLTYGFLRGSAVGDTQLSIYNAIVEYARLNNTQCNLKTYSNLYQEYAPAGHTLIPCSVSEVISDLHFQMSDVIFMPYCGHAPIADVLPFSPNNAKKVFLYFGITRPHLYPEIQQNLEESYKQAIVLNDADMVLVTSDYIAADVRNFGVPDHKIHKIPLFANISLPSVVPLRQQARKKIRLTFLSRFCSAKGVAHMFDALQQWEDDDWSLDVIYHGEISDKVLLKKYQEISKKNWKGRVRWHETIDEDTKCAILEDTDILLSPSLHEGFGIPLIEALRYGCALVHSDAGSQPEISGSLGLQFPARDVPAFVQCLNKSANARRRGMYACSLASGELSAEQWREYTQAHVDYYTYENFKQQLCSLLFSDLPKKYGNLHELLAERRVATLNSMGLRTRPLPPIPQFVLNSVNEALAPLMPSIQKGGTIPSRALSVHSASCAEPHDPQLLKLRERAHLENAEVLNIYNSFSWKITAPLRSLSFLFEAMTVAFGRKDPVRERARGEWDSLISFAATADDWQRVIQNRRDAASALHSSISWKLSAPIRNLYELASKSNILRKVYAKFTRKPYIPYK